HQRTGRTQMEVEPRFVHELRNHVQPLVVGKRRIVSLIYVSQRLRILKISLGVMIPNHNLLIRLRIAVGIDKQEIVEHNRAGFVPQVNVSRRALKFITNIIGVYVVVVSRHAAAMGLEVTAAGNPRRPGLIKDIVVDHGIGGAAAAIQRTDLQRPTLRIYRDVSPDGIVALRYFDRWLVKGHQLAHILDDVSFHQFKLRPLDALPSHAPSAVHNIVQPAVVTATLLADTNIVAAAGEVVTPDYIVRGPGSRHLQNKSPAA